MRPHLPPLRALALLLPLSACTLSPQVTDSRVTPPATYQEVDATMTGAWPTLSWWQAFGSPELDRLMTQTQAANLDIAAAIAQIQQAQAQLRIAGAPLFPALSADGQASRQRQNGSSRTTLGSNGVLVSQGGGVTVTNYQAALSASYALDFWGANRAALNAARASELASQYNKETVALTALATTATTYFNILALQDQLDFAAGNLKIAQDTLAVIAGRIKAGVADALALANQRTVVAQQQATLAPLQLQLTQNRNALAILTGRTPEMLQVQGGSLNDLALPAVAPGLPSELLTRRPDVQQAEANLAAQRANIQAARAALFPSISLTAQSGYQSRAFSDLFGPSGFFYSTAAGLTQPIFQGYALRGQVELERGIYQELVADYRKTVISAFTDVDNALSAIRRSSEQEREQQTVIAAASEAYDIAQAQLKVGIVDITDVLTAEANLFNARNALAQIRLTRLNAIVSLYQALGGGWALPARAGESP